MSRSKRKTLIIGHGGGSEKKDKQICNKRLRRKSKMLLNDDIENYQDPKQDEMHNKWNMQKDDKSYFGDIYDKTSEFFKRMIRK